MLARLMIIGALACGLIGLIIGVVDREWKLGVTGWFTGGTLLAVIAISVLIDEYVERTRADA
jgi:hypothetical protein